METWRPNLKAYHCFLISIFTSVCFCFVPIIVKERFPIWVLALQSHVVLATSWRIYNWIGIKSGGGSMSTIFYSFRLGLTTINPNVSMSKGSVINSSFWGMVNINKVSKCLQKSNVQNDLLSIKHCCTYPVKKSNLLNWIPLDFVLFLFSSWVKQSKPLNFSHLWENNLRRHGIHNIGSITANSFSKCTTKFSFVLQNVSKCTSIQWHEDWPRLSCNFLWETESL